MNWQRGKKWFNKRYQLNLSRFAGIGILPPHAAISQ
jgi:hypothetical protein